MLFRVLARTPLGRWKQFQAEPHLPRDFPPYAKACGWGPSEGQTARTYPFVLPASWQTVWMRTMTGGFLLWLMIRTKHEGPAELLGQHPWHGHDDDDDEEDKTHH